MLLWSWGSWAILAGSGLLCRVSFFRARRRAGRGWVGKSVSGCGAPGVLDFRFRVCRLGSVELKGGVSRFPAPPNPEHPNYKNEAPTYGQPWQTGSPNRNQHPKIKALEREVHFLECWGFRVESLQLWIHTRTAQKRQLPRRCVDALPGFCDGRQSETPASIAVDSS